MRNQYREHLDRLKLTEESKKSLVQELRDGSSGGQAYSRKHWKMPLAAAAVAACLGITAVGAHVLLPVIWEHYQNSPGYQQSVVLLGDSITKDGWTLTLTDAVMDDYNIELGFCLNAPEGTVLDHAGGYYLDQWELDIPDYEIGSSGSCTQVADEAPDDSSIRFIYTAHYCMDKDDSIQGKQMELRLGGLYHTGEWNESLQQWEHIFDCEETWSFTTQIDLPDNKIELEPHITVHTLDVDATLTRVEITPFGAYAYIEGDALKGHHSWVPKNAPDGWYGCVEYQEIVLNMRDGTALPLTDGISGSGCSGGTDPTESGWLHLARRTEELIDLEQVASITVCGKTISTK